MTTLRRVLLPLSARGLATAATFTFLLSLGFLRHPALLGGPSDTTIPMLIDSFVNERLDWPLAAAASMALLAMALAVIEVGAPLRADLGDLGGQVTPAGAWTKGLAALLAAVIVIPVTGDRASRVQQAEFHGTAAAGIFAALVGRLLRRPSWLRALATSFEVAALSCLLSVAAGTLAALGLPRLGPRIRTLANGLFLGPLIAPVIVLAVGLYALARSFGSGWQHTRPRSRAYDVGAALCRDERRRLGRGARSASRPRGEWAWRRPLARVPNRHPAVDSAGLFGGGVFAFVTSFDEVVLAVFLAGPSVKTLAGAHLGGNAA